MKLTAQKSIKTILIIALTLVLIFAQEFDMKQTRAASKTCIGYYNTSLPSGVASTGPSLLSSNRGYNSSGTKMNPTRSTFVNALQKYDVVFVHSHGSKDSLVLGSSSTTAYIVNKNYLVSSSIECSAKLVYLSACLVGSGDIPSTIVSMSNEKSAVVAFKQTITASTSSDGIHLFNRYVVTYLTQGYALYTAVSKAQLKIYEMTGKYYGADSCTIVGNNQITL